MMSDEEKLLPFTHHQINSVLYQQFGISGLDFGILGMHTRYFGLKYRYLAFCQGNFIDFLSFIELLLLKFHYRSRIPRI